MHWQEQTYYPTARARTYILEFRSNAKNTRTLADATNENVLLNLFCCARTSRAREQVVKYTKYNDIYARYLNAVGYRDTPPPDAAYPGQAAPHGERE